MKKNNINLKRAIASSMLALSLFVSAQDQGYSEYFLYDGDPIYYSMKVYYERIPNRFYIQKSPNIKEDSIIYLLSKLTDSRFEYNWCQVEGYKDNLCRVIVDDALIDNIINELLKNDGIVTARRIYVSKVFYDKYVEFLKQTNVDFANYFKEPNLNNKEIWYLNYITCTPAEFKPDLVPKDSICNALGLTYELENSTLIRFKASKNSDIFEIANKLFETKYFTRIDVNKISPYASMIYDNLYGTQITSSDHFFLYDRDSSKSFYYEIPDRFFIQVKDDVTQDYINTLLNRLIKCEFEKDWPRNEICRVFVDDALIDNIIDELLKDDGVLVARRIYVSKEDYNKYLFYPDLEIKEKWFLNGIHGYLSGGPNQVLIDSISNALGLTVNMGQYNSIWFQTPKKTDIFEVAQKLHEIGCFSGIHPDTEYPPMAYTWTEVRSTTTADIKEKLYYDLSGHKVDTPSGLTIVVTCFTDGSRRTEKTVFK